MFPLASFCLVKFSCIRHDVRVLAFLSTFHTDFFLFSFIIFKIKSLLFYKHYFSLILVSEMMAIFELTSCFSFHFFFFTVLFLIIFCISSGFILLLFTFNLMLQTNNKTKQDKQTKTHFTLSMFQNKLYYYMLHKYSIYVAKHTFKWRVYYIFYYRIEGRKNKNNNK